MEIKTEQEYDKIMERIEKIFDAKLGTAEGDELVKLSIVAEKWEIENYPLPEPSEDDVKIFNKDHLGK